MSDKPKWFLVWVETTTTPSPQLWPHNPEDRGPDSKQYGPKIASYHAVPDELNEVADGEHGLYEIAKRFPRPSVQP